MASSMAFSTRSPLSREISRVQELAEKSYEKAQEILGSRAYVSLVVERRHQKEFSVDPKGKSLNEALSFGWILRAFNGFTLFERASDQFESSFFEEAIEELKKELDHNAKVSPRIYQPPSWEERLKFPLEEEIRSQIPDGASAKTWVHFGTKMQKPLPQENAEIMELAEKEYAGFQTEKMDFMKLMYRLSVEEFLFMDASVRMSQSLIKPARVFVGVKKGHQVHVARGSLGGWEVIVEAQKQNQEELLKKLQKIEQAERLKPGRYKVLLSPSLAGVFAHEAFGHSQEADTWMRNRSKAKELYESQIRVGNDFATIVNNPALFENGEESTGAWGSYFFDEEGWLAQRQVLVEKGYLRPPMTDLTSSFRQGLPRSANGKREKWSHGMYSRQTNTYFESGEETFADLIGKMDYGFLATECFGGMEDPKGMGIQVGVQFLEEVKDGQLTGKTFVAPNGGAVQITGSVPEYLNSILGVSKIQSQTKAKDQVKHPWNEVGGCGKYHKEYVKAGCGGVYLLLDQVNLG